MTASRRRQRGSLQLEHDRWSLRLRVDELEADSVTPMRRERRIKLGTTAELRSRAAAERAAELLLERLSPRDIVPGTRIAARKYFDRYLAQRIALAKPATRAAFSTYVRKHLAPAFGRQSLEAIELGAVQALIARLAAAGLARSTIRGIVALLKRILDTAAREGFAAVPLDLRALTFPTAIEVERSPRCFTLEESARIIAAAPWPWRALYACLAYTGIRSGEALGLAWSHVDLDGRRLLIRQAASCGRLQTLKSKNSRADLAIPAPLAAILAEYRAVWRANPLELLFPSPANRPLWAAGVRRRHLTPLLERLGIAHGGFHAFRHGMATNLFAAGASAPTVRQMLRHGDIRTTLRYTHVTEAQLRAASDAIGAALSRGENQPQAPT